MKRIFKALTVLLLAAVAACACALCITACGGESKSDYNFTIVYEDGSAVNGQTDGVDGKVPVQICGTLANGKDGCIDLTVYPSESGKINFSQAEINELFDVVPDTPLSGDVTEFVFHVKGVKNHKSDCEVAVNGKGDYKVTVTK